MKKVVALLLTFLLIFSLVGCGAKKNTSEFFAMDTYMSLVVYGDTDVLTQCCQEINRLERLFSRTLEDSEISRLNRDGIVDLSEDTWAILDEAIAYEKVTAGAFDITVAPLVEAWDITADHANILSQEEIDSLLPMVDITHLSLGQGTATLSGGSMVDLGAIAKGYASDRIAFILSSYEVENAAISLGGNVYVKGINPEKNQPWNVAIQDPQGDGYAVMLSLSDVFAVTSGGYQRYYEDENGNTYIHIIDPETGKPVDNDLLSVTIIGDSGSMADAYSTALFVMGQEKAIQFYKVYQDFDMVLITKDNKILYTPGLEGEIEKENDTYEILPILEG